MKESSRCWQTVRGLSDDPNLRPAPVGPELQAD
jgi:hypothetical protein